MPERMNFETAVTKTIQFESFILGLIDKRASKLDVTRSVVIHMALVEYLKRRRSKLKETEHYTKREGTWYYKVMKRDGSYKLIPLTEYQVHKLVHGEDMSYEEYLYDQKMQKEKDEILEIYDIVDPEEVKHLSMRPRRFLEL
jgi:hypothetical protein